MREIYIVLSLFLFVNISFAQSLVVKVDMNMSGRPDSEVLEPGYVGWAPETAVSVSKTVDGVTFTFKKVGNNGSTLRPSWAKADVQIPVNAQLVGDGIYVDGGDAGAQIELTISGLKTGTHTLLTYHNAFSTSACAPMDISVNGSLVINDLAISSRATKTSSAGMSYLTLNATSGNNIVILFKAETSSSASLKNVFINGFELNTGNPKKQSRNPIPEDADGHVDPGTGSILLKWEKAPDAVSHRIYFSTDESCVKDGTTGSSCYKGQQTGTTLNVSGIYSMDSYFWRVDEVDVNGVVTKGAVWSFHPRQLAFPGAEGYGRFARGGRGGKVVHVTNLNDAGAGSLRYAVENETGPRIIVFDVSGIIALGSRLVVSDPYVTIAGQTAPGKGICIRKAPIGFTGNDVIVRHLRLRLGGGPTYDGMGLTGANNSIMDHCSISWTIDEAFSSRSARNITLQRTFISEALNVAGHQNYPAGTGHGYAGTISGRAGSYHHNLLAHCEGRNFSMGSAIDGGGNFDSKLDIFNNVVYNFGSRATDGQCHKLNFVNNYYKKGAATRINFTLSMDFENYGTGTQEAYYSGNILANPNGSFVCDGTNNTCGRRYTLSNGNTEPTWNVFPTSGPLFPSYATIHSAKDAYKNVLSDVGANQPVFDDHDIRVVNETINGTYKYTGSVSGKPGLPDNESDVGGYESYPTVTRASNWDTDKDGLPDFWEIYYGTNKNSTVGNFSEANADPDKDGYTNLEDYLNWMAEIHYFLSFGSTQSINLKDVFRGYNTSPTYKATNAVNCTVTISGATATVKPTSCGMASFNLVVTDADGSTMTRKVGVFTESNPLGTCVSNNLKAPTVTITAPVNNTSKQEPASFNFTVTAMDADGTISKVEYFNGTTLIGTSTTSPYSFTWDNVAVGTYNITAVATDNDGLKSTSVAINLIVTAGPKKYIYNYDNSGNSGWENTNSWTPKAVPTAIDTVIIRTGEVRIGNLNHTGPVFVETNGILRLIDTSAVNDLRLQGGTLKAYTSAPGMVLTSNIKVEAPSTIMAGSVAATIFTLNGTISGNSDLSKTSVGNLRINSNASTYKGNWIITEGKLQLRSASGLGVCGVQVKGGARLDVEAAASIYSLKVDTLSGVDLDQPFTADVTILGSENVNSGSYTNAVRPSYVGGANTLTVKNSILTTSGGTSICPGASVQLSTISSSSYSWKNLLTQVGTAQTYTAGATGDYTVSISNANGCKVTSANTKVTVSAAPTVSITTTTPTSICAGGSVVLTASAGNSYKWFNGTTQVGTSQAYTATTAGDYTVEVTNATGCKATSEKTTVTINPLPVATITAGSSTTICSGGSVVLTASAGSSYKWFNGTTPVGASQTYAATASGDYTVEVTNAYGCKATSVKTTVTVNSLPTAAITAGSSTTLCAGESVTLTSSAGSSYKWYNGTIQVGTGQTHIVTNAGDYTVEVINANGCKATSLKTTVTVNSLPTATITAGSSTTLCAGESVTLTSSAGSSYKWYNGTTLVGTSQTYAATNPGDYKVEVTNESGCKVTSLNTTVIVNSLPTAMITAGSATALCAGESVTLTSSAGSSYKWYNGTTQVGTSQTYIATTTGDYSVEVTSEDNCKLKSSSVPVEVNICTGIGSGQSAYSFQAFPNPFTREVEIQHEGKFTYELYDSKGLLVKSGEAVGQTFLGNDLSAGLYFLRIFNGTKSNTIQLVKE